MSLRRNTLANYAGWGYSALIGVVIMPLYLKFLGAEMFGLVGFLVMLQAWLPLLDLGFSPTLARYVAVARGREEDMGQFGQLLRSFEIIFFALAVAVAAGIFLSSPQIASEWIDSTAVDNATVAYCVSLMGAIVALRFVASLYRSGIRGMEDQVWLNVATILVATVRSVGALLIMVFISADIQLFFHYHVAVGLIELILLAQRFYSSLSLSPLQLPFKVDVARLKSVAPFALSVAYASAIWVVMSQTDKLILSTVLPLREFGYFTLVSLLSGVILLITGPITQALLPRMTSLVAAGRQEDMVSIYRGASQLVAVIAISAALLLSFYTEALVYAWTGDREAARWCADVLPWFALGNGFLALGAFQYFLQNAFGRLKLHVVGSTVSALIQVPIILYAAIRFGAEGAGIAWLAIRATWFVVWTAIVHRTFVPGLHSVWLLKDLLPVAAVGVVTIIALVSVVSIDLAQSRWNIALVLTLLGIAQFTAMAISSKFVRSTVVDYFSKTDDAAA